MLARTLWKQLLDPSRSRWLTCPSRSPSVVPYHFRPAPAIPRPWARPGRLRPARKGCRTPKRSCSPTAHYWVRRSNPRPPVVAPQRLLRPVTQSPPPVTQLPRPALRGPPRQRPHHAPRKPTCQIFRLQRFRRKAVPRPRCHRSPARSLQPQPLRQAQSRFRRQAPSLFQRPPQAPCLHRMCSLICRWS